MRRTAGLCGYCLRNLAFHRAWHDVRHRYAGDEFWITTGNNFIDVAVLEWCKLFADHKGKFHWKKIVTDKSAFKGRLLHVIGQSEAEFAIYIDEMKTYRDKFVAHLDYEESMFIPETKVMEKTSVFLYDHLLEVEDEDLSLFEAPQSGQQWYQQMVATGQQMFASQ